MKDESSVERNLISLCQWLQRNGHSAIYVNYSGSGDSGDTMDISVDGKYYEDVSGKDDLVFHTRREYQKSVATDGMSLYPETRVGEVMPFGRLMHHFAETFIDDLGNASYENGEGGGGSLAINANGIINYSHYYNFTDLMTIEEFDVDPAMPTFGPANMQFLDWLKRNGYQEARVYIELPRWEIDFVSASGSNGKAKNINYEHIHDSGKSFPVVDLLWKCLDDLRTLPAFDNPIKADFGQVLLTYDPGGKISVELSENTEQKHTEERTWDLSEHLAVPANRRALKV
jgi:hypothetical protein